MAALVSWLLIETTLNTFKPKDTAIQRGGSTFLFPDAQERAATVTRNAELAMGLTGATLGLLLGMAGGLRARPPGLARLQRFWAWCWARLREPEPPWRRSRSRPVSTCWIPGTCRQRWLHHW